MGFSARVLLERSRGCSKMGCRISICGVMQIKHWECWEGDVAYFKNFRFDAAFTVSQKRKK